MQVQEKMVEIKPELHKEVGRLSNALVVVKVYDWSERGEDGFDVEIFCYDANNPKEYIECWVTNTYTADEGKDAMNRARAVLRTVKSWFEYDKEVTVEAKVVKYTA